MRELAPLHVSRDHLYAATERGAGRAAGGARHTRMALEFQPGMLPTFPHDAFTPLWHRPRCGGDDALLLLLHVLAFLPVTDAPRCLPAFAAPVHGRCRH